MGSHDTLVNGTTSVTYVNVTDHNVFSPPETLAHSLKGEKGDPGPKGMFAPIQKEFGN